MTKSSGWARLWALASVPRVRRGAWYPIVHDGASENVVIGLPGRNVRVPRHLLEIRDDRPQRFTVVFLARSVSRPAQGTGDDLGRRYAVCPCGSRLRMAGRPLDMECPTCGHRGEVAWWETG